MATLFSKPKIPDAAVPKPVRMPTEQDPSLVAAAERAKQAARNRRGRQSTILTEGAGTGSSGQSLGA